METGKLNSTNLDIFILYFNKLNFFVVCDLVLLFLENYSAQY